MKNFLLIVLLCISYFLLGQDYYVLSKNGLNLRNSPSNNSEIIMVVPYNTKVKIIKNKASNKFEVNGYSGTYVKIEYKGKEGFIFSGFLSQLEGVKESETLQEYFIRKFGKPDISKRGGDEIWSFANGFKYEVIGEAMDDSSYEDRYYFKNMSIQEVFLFLRDIPGLLNSARNTSELEFNCKDGCDFETEEGLYNGYSIKIYGDMILFKDFGEI